jgi:phosphatidylserine/phosphatidylglycerophosphate/cardiolipin synthase-like enzyme
VAWFTDVDIYNAVLDVQNKGVNVYIIIANHEFNQNSRVDYKKLLENNGCVSYIGNINDSAGNKLMHNKFSIIDDSILITGSYNWTYKARMNDENIIVIDSEPNVIQKFNGKFDSFKPQYGFTINKQNAVELLPIEHIMNKWDNPDNLMPEKESLLDISLTLSKF